MPTTQSYVPLTDYNPASPETSSPKTLENACTTSEKSQVKSLLTKYLGPYFPSFASVSKKELLKNIQSYSPEEIADAIRAGIVTLYELGHDTEGQFTPLLKKQVKDILARPVTPHVVSVSTSQNTT